MNHLIWGIIATTIGSFFLLGMLLDTFLLVLV